MIPEPPPIPSDSGPGPVPQQAHGSAAGWIFLIIMAAFYVTSALFSYFGTSRTAERDLMSDASLKQTVMAAAVRKRLTSLAGPSPKELRAKTEEQALQSLDSVREAADARASKSVEAALVQAVASQARKMAPSPTALKTLSQAEDPGVRGYASAVTAAKLTPPEAEAAAAALKGKSFVRDMARRQLREKAGDRNAMKGLIPDVDADRFLLIILAGFLAASVGAAVFLAGLIAHVSKKWPARGLPSPPLDAEGADRYAFRMALYLAIMILSSVVAAGFLRNASLLPGSLAMLIPLLVTMILTFVMLRVPIAGVADSFKAILGDTANIPRKVMVGIGAFLANIPVMLVLVAVTAVASQSLQKYLPPPSHPVNSLMEGGAALDLFCVFMAASVLAPLLEETAFRGLMRPALTRLWGPAAAILVQGLFFASIHPQGPLVWPMLAAIGCMAAVVSYKEGSLIPGMVMHAVHNTVILIIGLNVM